MSLRLETLFLLLSLSLGLLYIALTPPLRNFDESSHLLKIFALTNLETGPATIPDDVREFVLRYRPSHVVDKGLRYSFPTILDELGTRSDYSKTHTMQSNTADGYFMIVYWPAVLTTAILKHVYPSTMLILYMARLSMLITATLILYATIKRAAIQPRLLLLISLAPMALFLRAGLGADCLTYAYCVAFINLALASRHQPSARHFYGLLALGIAVGLSKNVYIGLVLLTLIAPRFPLPLLTSAHLQKAVLIGLPCLATALWSYYVTSVIHIGTESFNYFNRYTEVGSWFQKEVDAHKQLAYIMEQPFHYGLILIGSLCFWLITQSPSILGVIDTNLSFEYGGSYLLLGVAALLLLYSNTGHYTYRQRSVFAIICALLIGAIFTAMYLYFVSVQNGYIYGVQGRYFLPLLPLLLAIFSYTPRKPPRIPVLTFALPLWIILNAQALYMIYALNF
ncbi:MAG: DUF2142 domain-containing protein [Rickettsiales bacterium]|nr:DUF2142 domain-containing protein [Rickettsiales bacterium]